MIQRAIEKASVLVEAMPFIQRFRGDTVVVKFGGSILDDPAGYENILRDLAFMEIVGLRPVLVHGGGKAISAAMHARGLKANFLHGLRVTDEDTIKLVEQVLNHEVNPHLVEVLQKHDCKARGFFGQDLLTVKKHTRVDEVSGERLDWGFVGEVTHANVAPLVACLDTNTVPVVTPLGRGEDGHIYNVNADQAAGALACALNARKLVFLSDVPGLLHDMDDPESLISTLHLDEVEMLIQRKVISGGMLPKVNGAIKALHAGVKKTHIIDAGMPHSLLLELFTAKGVGTEILSEELDHE